MECKITCIIPYDLDNGQKFSSLELKLYSAEKSHNFSLGYSCSLLHVTKVAAFTSLKWVKKPIVYTR